MNRGREFVIGAVTSSVIGLAVSAAWIPAVALSIALPALWIRQPSARSCFCCALTYYITALHALPEVARNFFGPNTGFIDGLGLWLVASGILALPWLWLWSHSAKAALWRVPLALLMSVIPPLGLIGWASPTVAAGLLFPATGYVGFAMAVCLPACLAVAPKRTIVCAVSVVVLCNAFHPQPPHAPGDWEAIDTHYGAVSHERIDPLREYKIAEDVQSRSLSSTARVIVFPESVIPRWTTATDHFWAEALTGLKQAGKTVVIGAIAPIATAGAQSRGAEYDFTASISALRQPTRRSRDLRVMAKNTEQLSYKNEVVIRGAETGTFIQRVPIPLGMWRPFTNSGAPLGLGGAGVIRIAEHHVAIIICYEQLIPWPVLSSFVERPSIVIAIANNVWVSGTPIPRVQQKTMRAWARLFHVPIIFAANS